MGINTEYFHDESFNEVLDHFGRQFGCERIYIFEKNDNHYDCINEWCNNPNIVRKDTLQNLSKESVSFFYKYFNNNKDLVVRNMNDLFEEDKELYIVLSVQNLESTIVTHLSINGEDLGFMGIDNVDSDLFDETYASLKVASYLVSYILYNKKKV